MGDHRKEILGTTSQGRGAEIMEEKQAEAVYLQSLHTQHQCETLTK